MNAEKILALESAADLLMQARERLGSHAPSRTRLLLDLMLLDLAEQLASLIEPVRH